MTDMRFTITRNNFPEASARMRQAIGAGFAASKGQLLADMQQRTPVPYRGNTNVAQVVRSDLGQQIKTNVVVLKSTLVILQPQGAQPRRQARGLMRSGHIAALAER